MSIENNSIPFASGDCLGMRGKNKWRKTLALIALGLLLLVIGGVGGTSLAILHFRQKLLPSSNNSARIGRMLSSSIMKEVKLTAAEKVEIDAIVTTGMKNVDTLNQEYGDKVQERFDAMCSKICSLLGPERSLQWQACVNRDFGEKAAQRIHKNACTDETTCPTLK